MAAGGPVSGLRVGNLVGRKSRCLNHYLLENRVWVKQEVGAAPAPPCTHGVAIAPFHSKKTCREVAPQPKVAGSRAYHKEQSFSPEAKLFTSWNREASTTQR